MQGGGRIDSSATTCECNFGVPGSYPVVARIEMRNTATSTVKPLPSKWGQSYSCYHDYEGKPHPLCRSWGPKEASGRKRAGSRALRSKALSCDLEALDSAEGILDWLATVLSFRQRWSSTLQMKRRHGHQERPGSNPQERLSYAASSSLSCHSNDPRID